MEEKNRATLERAIKNLPGFLPSASTWKAIESELGFYEKEAALRRSLRRLPEYAPPPMVWEHISEEIHRPLIRKWMVQLHPYRWVAAIALLLLTYAGMFWHEQQQKPQVAYLISSEPGYESFSAVLPPQDQVAFEEVGAQFAKYHKQFGDPQGDELISELEELNAASHELRDVLEKYGFDERLAQDLTRVELERNQVIKKMAMVL